MPYKDPEKRRENQRIRHATWKRNHPERARILKNAQARRRTRRIRDECYEAYGDACVCCGSKNRDGFQLDHINNDGKAHRLAVGEGHGMHLWLRRNGFPSIVQILCVPCHREKTRGRVCVH